MVRKRSRAGVAEHVVETHEAIFHSICDKWAMLILHRLGRGIRRYGDLRREVPGISQRMLTRTLRRLEHRALVTRTVYPSVPPKVEYALTPLAKTLSKPLGALYQWAEDNREQFDRARREMLRGRDSEPE